VNPPRGRCELAGAVLVIGALEQAEQEAPVSHLERARKGRQLRVNPLIYSNGIISYEPL
jgi:hypothetical protein